MRDLPNLDLMRSIAVILVVFDHMSIASGRQYVHGVNLGWVGIFGVYLFFLHTSLVLMWSLQRQPHVLNFYIRRAFRIYPLAMVATLAAVLMAIAFPQISGVFLNLHPSLVEIATNLLLIQNFGGYRNLLGVLWSLPLEVDMYIVLPLLFLYTERLRKFWPLLVLALAAMCAGTAERNGNTLITVTPFFICGPIAFLAYERFRTRFSAWLFPVFLLIELFVFMVKPRPFTAWPIILLLAFALPLFQQISSPALVKSCHHIAKYSYGIYLGHSFGLIVGFFVFPHLPRVLQITISLLITGVIAVIAYHVVEEPLIRMGSRLAKANDRREARNLLATVSPTGAL